MMNFCVFFLVALLSMPIICSAQEVSQSRSLNEIRFDGWTDKDWLSNDYIRALRCYVDACYRGEMENDALSAYRDASQSKFVVLSIRPALLGGVSILFSFLDVAEKVFSAHVYSEVDVAEGKVNDYRVLSLQLCEEESGFIKEEYLRLAAENSQILFW